jgi:hypothetical protein
MSKTSRGKDPTVKGEVQSSLFDSPVADDHANVITALQADFEIPKGLIERLKPEEAKNFLDALRETAELLAAVSDEDAPKPASGSPFLASLGLSAELSGADDTPLMSSSGPPQFFVCDAIDPPVKDDMASMEHPMFTLQKTPDKNIRKYEHNGVHIEITPSVKGMATLWDKDILIVAISHLLAKMNSGIQTHRTVRFRASEMLRTTQRGIGGSAYMQLVDGLDRLAGTRIKTDIKTGNRRTREGFGLIESWKVVQEENDERMSHIEITISDWLWRAILGREVLTLSPDYFGLTSAIERRLYEIARKHCGSQPKFSISLEVLHKKVGSTNIRRQFRHAIKQCVEEDRLPDYHLHYEIESDMVTFIRREVLLEGRVTRP